jgi:hypothetical protein
VNALFFQPSSSCHEDSDQSQSNSARKGESEEKQRKDSEDGEDIQQASPEKEEGNGQDDNQDEDDDEFQRADDVIIEVGDGQFSFGKKEEEKAEGAKGRSKRYE